MFVRGEGGASVVCATRRSGLCVWRGEKLRGRNTTCELGGRVCAVCAVERRATSYTVHTPPASRGHAVLNDCEEEEIMHLHEPLPKPTRTCDSHGGCHWGQTSERVPVDVDPRQGAQPQLDS